MAYTYYLNQERKHRCDVCGYRFLTRVGLREHQKTHADMQPTVEMASEPELTMDKRTRKKNAR